jgi:hypothetical protein
VVERGPEKAGVGGSIPSLATIAFFLAIKYAGHFCALLRSIFNLSGGGHRMADADKEA